MYYVMKEKGGIVYASAAKTIRDGRKTRTEYTYLGRVVDKEKGIFYSRDRDYFTYNLETNEFGKVDESFEPPVIQDRRCYDRRAIDFGDAYLLDQILWKSGFWEVVDTIKWANKDTLHAMLLFYITSLLPNQYADIWYKGNVVSLLYPKARMTGEGISDFLEKIGREDSLLDYQEKYVEFVLENYSKDKNVMVDSMGLPNKCRVYLTQMNVHNNKVSVESRLVVVAQRSTGIQMFFYLLPGNINDATTLKPVFEHCKELGINVDGCLLDAGYSTDINLDEFYDAEHNCICDYITRPKSTAAYYKEALEKVLPDLETKENFVQYEDRFLYIKHVEVMVGKKKNQPAHLYIGLDKNRLSDELHKLLKRAKKKKLPIEEVYNCMESQGIFALVSGKEYSAEEILPEYYTRQGIEQLNDISKNYTKLLPIRCISEGTYKGHVVMSMVATAVVRFIQIHLNESELYLGSRIEVLRTQKAILYKTKIVPDPVMKHGNDMYNAFGIPVPVRIYMKEDALQVERPKKVKHLFKTPQKRFHRTGSMKQPSEPSETSDEKDDTKS